MIEQIKKAAEKIEASETKKLLLESEITHLEEVLKHGISSQFAEENAIYIYSPKMGHEIRKKLEEDYKLRHPKLSIPKKIAELLDIAIEGLTKFEDFLWAVDEFDVLIPKSKVEYFRNWTNEEPNAHALAVSYVTGKAIGVELVEVVE